MQEITLKLPNFAEMDDEDVRKHPLAARRDGKWSTLTQHFREKFGTPRLQLNEAWARVPEDWRCPACLRWKFDIARITDSGVILCQLDFHHDHLGDLAMKLLRQGRDDQVASALRASRSRARAAVLPLVERFSKTLLCNDCNSADAAMKAALGKKVNPAFSFSPSEITSFVIPKSNASHELDESRGAQAWQAADEDFRERLVFVERMAVRINNGRHDREDVNYYGWSREDGDALLLDKLAREQSGARGDLPRLDRDLLKRSLSSDGSQSSSGKVVISDTRPPNPEEFSALHDRKSARPGPWRRAPDDWRCACCGRTKFEIVRRSNKGCWTADIMEIHDFNEEWREVAIAYRSIYRSEGSIFSSLKTITVCQDCRLILTRANQLTGRSQSISPSTITYLVQPALHHQAHQVETSRLKDACEADSDWSLSAKDFWTHHAHVGEIALLFKQLESRLRSDVAARASAIAELKADGKLAETAAAQHFDWLMQEHDRLRREDDERK